MLHIRWRNVYAIERDNTNGVPGCESAVCVCVSVCARKIWSHMKCDGFSEWNIQLVFAVLQHMFVLHFLGHILLHTQLNVVWLFNDSLFCTRIFYRDSSGTIWQNLDKWQIIYYIHGSIHFDEIANTQHQNTTSIDNVEKCADDGRLWPYVQGNLTGAHLTKLRFLHSNNS